MSKTYKTGAPWYLWFIALFLIFVYANGVYDYFMMLGHNMDYYEAKGLGEETYKYFTNYPIGLLVFWTTNILCGITSPILLLFRSRLTVCVAFISAVSLFLLDAIGFMFCDRWEAVGTFLSLFDIGLLILTWIFYFYCRYLKKKGILKNIKRTFIQG